MRLPGNVVRDLLVTAVNLGEFGAYESLVDVPEVLRVGDATDVPLGPNEYAEFTLKLNTATPQIVQPEVKRFRNSTFQATAADMSIWDAKGRLVWSNNRNLEEEVLSGRLGQEPQLSERFATLANATDYKLIVDPHTEIAGRFRVSVVSSAVNADVALGSGPIQILPGGTFTGVVELRAPTRYRLVGANACVVSTSLAEWSPSLFSNVAGPCVLSDSTITLPPGVHRLRFDQPLTKPSSFSKVVDGTPPDSVATVLLQLNGLAGVVPSGSGIQELMFVNDKPGARVVISGSRQSDAVSRSLQGTLIGPDGEIRAFDGPVVLANRGKYVAVIGRDPSAAQKVLIATAINEIRSVTQALTRAGTIYTLASDERLEVSMRVTARGRYRTVLVSEKGEGVDLVLIADGLENRYPFEDTVDLVPGTYRFVFVGSGRFRFALQPVASRSR